MSKKMVVRKAIIPAAGYGTRFLPVTKSIAKEMFPIVDTPTIQFIVEEAIASGIKEFLIIVSANKNSIIDYFDRNFELETILKAKGKMHEYDLITELPNKVNIHFLRQKEQLGLGHAVLQARAFVGNEPFALLLGDDVYVGNNNVPALKQLVETFEETQASIVGTLRVPQNDVSKYGICKFIDTDSKERLNKLADVIEKPSIEVAPSNVAIGGRYILTPAIFDLLETQTRGAGGEIQLTDSIRRLMNKENVYSYEIDGRRYDIGSRAGYLEATIDFALKRSDLHDQVVALLKRKVNEL